MDLLVQKLSEEAILPEKAYDSDSGFDLFSRTHIVLQPLERYSISTQIAIKLPNNYGAMVCDRSSNALKRGFHTLGQIIDQNYTGEIRVCIINLSDTKQIINIGDKIAQLILLPVPKINIVQVQKLPPTDRNSQGFGSSDR